MIRIMSGVRLFDRVLNDVVYNRVSVVVKIEDIIRSHLWWYSHVMRGHISSQTHEVMEAEITGKRKKGRDIWNDQGNCEEGFETTWLEKRCVLWKEMARAN